MIDLDAIRARDRDYDDVFDAQANMSKDIAHRLAAWPVADRRALLAYVDEQEKYVQELRVERAAFRQELDALRAAAGKVTCWRCEGFGELKSPYEEGAGMDDADPCPDCTDLRRYLGEP